MAIHFKNVLSLWKNNSFILKCSLHKPVLKQRKYFYRGYVHSSHLERCNCASTLHFNNRNCVTSHGWNHSKRFYSAQSEENPRPTEESYIDELETICKGISGKITYNSLLQRSKLTWRNKAILRDKDRKLRLQQINKKDRFMDIPIALKYLKLPETETERVDAKDTISENEVICLPYSIKTKLESISIDTNEPENLSNQERHIKTSEHDIKAVLELSRASTSTPGVSKWMSDYECYDELEEEEEEPINKWQSNYGTPNSNIARSNVPCGGCGALLHCQDTAIPGYLPSEIFENKDEATLRSIVCQRCHFMRYYNTALNVIVPPDDYPKLMSHLKDSFALIILMVDILDFPCSIWPGIMDIIGWKQPVVIAANKVDLLPPDSRGYLDRMKQCLTENLHLSGIPPRNIKHVALISAKTGYGVEELITKLHNIWQYKGDVYLLGCTNVGKSTLFNALLQSDFCKVKAVDLVQRATTSVWPGTTINLLKFPILRPDGWRLYERTRRLQSLRAQKNAEQALHQQQMKEDQSYNVPSLIGNIGMTFYQKEPVEEKDPFSLGKGPTEPAPLSGLDPKDKEFASSKWCYDTPGVVHPDQVINLLTTEELLLTLPKKMILPRSFRLSPNMTLFVAGLGRLDYIQGDGPIRITVFASRGLPITICKTEDADELYEKLLGTKFLAVPRGGAARLAHWPALQAHPEDFELEGMSSEESCADILLSSAGWVALTPERENRCKFRGWTPNGNGVHMRIPSLLPFAVTLCGPKIKRSVAYRRGRAIFRK